jgi:hypothetical protein
VTLEGDITLPETARAIVLFAHGSGSSRHSPRNRHVARLLNEGNLATLLVDLLTPHEEEIDLQTAHLRSSPVGASASLPRPNCATTRCRMVEHVSAIEAATKDNRRVQLRKCS